MAALKSLAVATFTPRETEQITGVSQALQRDWRRRELTSFETRKGRKRFTTYDLAHLIVMDQLLTAVRPATAYLIARMSCAGPIQILAMRAYPKVRVKLDGEVLERKQIERFTAYTRLINRAETTTVYHATDLDSLRREAKTRAGQEESQDPVAFHILIDLSEIADQLQSKQIRPYFVEVDEARP